jgi:hypothetical protein
VKVKQNEQSARKVENLWDSDYPEEQLDVVAIYQSMLKLMQPGETVQRAIKRLGNNEKPGSRGSNQKFRRSAAAIKKRETSIEQSDGTNNTAVPMDLSITDEPTKNSGKEDLLALIGYADKLLSMNGEMEIYQDTYEKLNLKVKQLAGNVSEAASTSAAVDSGLDMFADDSTVSSTPSSTSVEKSQDNASSGSSSS